MALRAGRVGVRKDQVDVNGIVKQSVDPYVLPTASAETLGGVKVGSGLAIADGVLSSVLPTASADTLGGVKVGSGLSITDGVLSATGGNYPGTTEFSGGNYASNSPYNDNSPSFIFVYNKGTSNIDVTMTVGAYGFTNTVKYTVEPSKWSPMMFVPAGCNVTFTGSVLVVHGSL